MKLKELKKFLGAETLRYLILCTLIGLLWFLVEASFVYVFQVFLFSIGLVEKQQLSDLFLHFDITPTMGIVALILYGFFRFITSFSKNILASSLQHGFIRRKRSEIFRKGLEQAGIIPTGLVLSMFSETVSQAGTLLFYVSNAIVSGVSTILLIAFGLSVLPKEMLISLSMLVLFVFPYRVMSKKIQGFGNILINEWESVNKNMISALKNNMFLRIHNLDHEEYRKGEKSLIHYEVSYKKYTVYSALISMVPPFYGLLIIAGVSISFSSVHTNNPFNLITFIYIFMRMAQSASETLGTLAFIKLNLPGFKRIWKWSYFDQEDIKDNGNERLNDINSINFKDVNFCYEEGKDVLKDISFEIVKGDILVIKGESGSGKSTLLSLLLGLNYSKSGSIFINQKDSNEVNISKVLGYVGPAPYLIEGTIRDNINYSHGSNYSKEEILKSLDQVNLLSIVNSSAEGIDKKLFENAQLSTGQKQRLCMARALIANPRLLVLDEATANLDEESERAVISSITANSPHRITIIVTHKNSFDHIRTKQIILPSTYAN